jgi:hypothetical protein
MALPLSHFPLDLAIALAAGLISLGVNYLVAWSLFTAPNGLPFPVTHIIPGCFGPGYPLDWLAYDPLKLALDGVFWTGLTFVIVAFIDWAATRGASGVGENGRGKSLDSTLCA